MKRIIYVLALLLTMSFYTVGINAEETNVNDVEATEQTVDTENDQAMKADYLQTAGDIDTSEFIGLKNDGTLWVKGKNANGQFGLGHNNNVATLTKLVAIKDKITSFTYTDGTLKLIVNNSKYYIAGKNSQAYRNPVYTQKNTDNLYKAQGNIFVKVENNGNRITYFTNKNLTTVSSVLVLANQSYKVFYYYPNGNLKQVQQAFYSNNVPNKIINNYYDTNGRHTRGTEQLSNAFKRTKEYYRSVLKGKVKLVQEINYQANNKKGSIFLYGYDKNANYMVYKRTNKYDTAERRYSYINENYNSARVKTFHYYQSFDTKLNATKGISRVWYNARNGSPTKKTITITGIKYFSQKNRGWSGKKCYLAPYNNNIYNSGCMLSSFAMINSKYSTAYNPGQIKDKGLDCFLDYNKAASIFGYNLQDSWTTAGYNKNIGTSFSNSKRYVPNNKSTFTIKEALEAHMPVQLWMTYGKDLHRYTGHSIVAYQYVWTNNGKWDIKFYDPYTPNTPTRSLKDLAQRWYFSKAQIWIKK